MVPMTTVLERPLQPVIEPTQVWGVLLSTFAEGSTGIPVHATPEAALRYSERVLAARPDVEAELMTCIGSGDWMSVNGAKSITEVVAERWTA